MNTKGKESKKLLVTQFELSKLIYSSGILSKVKLTGGAKLVLIALANHYNANNEDMFPSQKYLANQLGISQKTVERAIAELAKARLVMYVTKKVNRYKFTNVFFDLVKMSVNTGQNVESQHRQNVGQTNKEEQKNNNKSFSFSSFKPQEGRNTSIYTVEQTRKELDAQIKSWENCSSPMDLNRDEALRFVAKMHPLLRNRGISGALIKKFGFSDRTISLATSAIPENSSAVAL